MDAKFGRLDECKIWPTGQLAECKTTDTEEKNALDALWRFREEMEKTEAWLAYIAYEMSKKIKINSKNATASA